MRGRKSSNTLLILAVIAFIVIVSILLITASPRTDQEIDRTSKNVGEETANTFSTNIGNITLKILSASILCDNVDIEKQIVSGKCFISILLVNNGDREVYVHSILFQGINVYAYINETVKPGENKTLNSEINIPGEVSIQYIQYGFLETSVGRIRVEFNIMA